MTNRLLWTFSIAVAVLSLSFKVEANALIPVSSCGSSVSEITSNEKEMVERDGKLYNLKSKRQVLRLYNDALREPKAGDYLVINTHRDFDNVTAPLKVVYVRSIERSGLFDLDVNVTYSLEAGQRVAGTFEMKVSPRGIYPSEVISSQKITINGKTFDLSIKNQRARTLEKLIAEYRKNPTVDTYAFENVRKSEIVRIRDSDFMNVIYEYVTSPGASGGVPENLAAPILFP